MTKIIEYRTKKWANKVLQVHTTSPTGGGFTPEEIKANTRIMYRIKTENDFTKAILISLGVPESEFKNEFKDIEKNELEEQIIKYGWKKVRKRRS